MVSLSLKVDKGFGNDGLLFAFPLFEMKERGERQAAASPGSWRSGEVFDARHVGRKAVGDEEGGGMAKGIAVVGIEIGGHAGSSFIAKEVREWVKLAGEVSFLEFILDRFDEEELGFDSREVDITMRVFVKEELLLNPLGKSLENSFGGGREVAHFCDEDFHFGHELQDPFRDEDEAVVFFLFKTAHNQVRQERGDLCKGFSLFGDEDGIGMGF